MSRICHALAVFMSTFIVLAGCRTGEVPGQGDISAQIACSGSDSLLATVYMAGGDMAAASAWCSCADSEACSVEFGGLGFGEYVLGIGMPDSMYLATEGGEGFVRPIGYYRQDGPAGDVESATIIALSADQPSTDVEFSLEAAPDTTSQ